MYSPKTQTGRTTRMLLAALAAAENGEDVLIVTTIKSVLTTIEQLKKLYVGTKPFDSLNIKVHSEFSEYDLLPSYHGVSRGQSGTTVRQNGIQVRRRGELVLFIKVFVDHEFIESYYKALLDELHRYDAPQT